jgi:formate-dependent nitrite reductase cytochrome c552 subunit
MKRLAVVLSLLILTAARGALAAAPEAKTVDPADCFECHTVVKGLAGAGAHKGLGCAECHGNLAAHLESEKALPTINLDLGNCGRCHQDQYRTFLTVNYSKRAKREKATPDGRAPTLDKLLAGHGFTKEHAEPRSHAFMLIDQVMVDRAAGGRYGLRNWADLLRTGKLWDVLEDRGETFVLPETAGALNPTCIQCKTSDFVAKWAFMGDASPRARWSRESKVHEAVKDAQNPMGCIHCHDPHRASPRIIRDALIEAVAAGGENPYAADKGTNVLTVQEVGGDTATAWRRIGLLSRKRTNLFCAQCHVEYACNPGFEKGDPTKKIGYADRRTNRFPWRNVADVLASYDQADFRDYLHPVTKAALIKFQHPEAETLFTSRHTRAGATCVDCHMWKEKGEGGKGTFTSHHMVSPRENLEGTCLVCHKDWDAKKAVYVIDSVKNYVRGKIRKSEYWLSILIDRFAAAEKAGVDAAALAEARAQHDIAHANWEWWTAENSDGFHNPDEARKSLTASIAASRKGIEILDNALKAKAVPPPPATPAPAR